MFQKIVQNSGRNTGFLEEAANLILAPRIFESATHQEEWVMKCVDKYHYAPANMVLLID